MWSKANSALHCVIARDVFLHWNPGHMNSAIQLLMRISDHQCVS